jgi:4-amino-4-deoxy-L-arabinose transferase-like glycosyltransferase
LSLLTQKSDQLSFLIIIFILAITLITAIISAPNNWDSMTYHLPKVMHWIQNKSVYPYPTNNLRQISFSPGASYFTLQAMLLSGNDYFANFIQWIAFLGSIICVSLIVHNIIGEKHQWIGAFLTACFPMAIMQSTTTQSDLVTAFWILCYAYFIFKDRQNSMMDFVWGGIAFGLAILTKPTALIYGIPLTILFWGKNIRWRMWQNQLLMIVTFFFCSLSFSLPHFLRNKAIFNSYLGIDTDTRATTFGLFQTLSSSLKNILINFPLNSLRNVIDWIHNNIIFLEIDDPTINLGGRNIMDEGNLLKYLVPHEDFVGSPIYLFLFILGSLTIFKKLILCHHKNTLKIGKIQLSNLSTLSVIVIVDFWLFSTLLKWAVFHNRLLLTISLLSIPVSVFFIQFIVTQKLREIIFSAIAIIAIFYSLTPIRHPLIALPIFSPQQQQEQSPSILNLSRSDIYFSGSRKELKIPYQKIVSLIVKNNCRNIGLAFEEDTWEYPLWVLLKNQMNDSFWIKNINVTNQSQFLNSEFPDNKVCAIISISSNFNPNDYFKPESKWISETNYRVINSKFSEDITLYFPSIRSADL